MMPLSLKPKKNPRPRATASKMKRFLKVAKVFGDRESTALYTARCCETGSMFLLKEVRNDEEQCGISCDVIREISTHKALNHPNILGLCQVMRSERKICIAFEYIAETLHDIILKYDSTGGVPDVLVKSYMYQILRAIDFCHTNRVLHRDLRPRNIFVNQHGGIKLSSFGHSRVFLQDQSLTHEMVTIWYRCPEILLGDHHYSTGIDIWSAGCILAELLTGKPLFPGDGSQYAQLLLIFQTIGTPTEATWPGLTRLRDYSPVFPRWPPRELSLDAPGLSPAASDLLRRTVVCDPSRRISARDAMVSAYFDDVEER